MASKQTEVGLPYLEITKVASQKRLRELEISRRRETYGIDFLRLTARPGFNFRKEYSYKDNTIEDFAMYILANGLPEPLVVDVLEDGTVYIEQGHRRQKAMELLHQQGLLYGLDKPMISNGKVECFVNDNNVDELTRLKRQVSSNNNLNFSTIEKAEIAKTMEIYFELSQDEIGKLLNMSRQHVKNHLIIAEQSDVVKQAIASGRLKPTAAVDLVRVLKNADAVTEKVQDAVSSGKAISVSDVKRIQGESKDDHLPSFMEIEAGEESKDVVVNPGAASHNTQSDGSEKTSGKEKPKKESKYDESREEMHFMQNVIKNHDKIASIVEKLPVNDQVKKDVAGLVELNQRYLSDIREWIHNNKKYNKKAT